MSSRLAASPELVWSRVATMRGVNFEMRPLARMTHPPGFDALNPHTVPIGKRAFRSWILLLGVLPIDYDDLTLIRLEPGRGFHERSSMLTQRRWEHERWLDPEGTGCTITDTVSFEPRVPAVGRLLLPLFRWVFEHRHRRLRKRFSGQDLDTTSDRRTA